MKVMVGTVMGWMIKCGSGGREGGAPETFESDITRRRSPVNDRPSAK